MKSLLYLTILAFAPSTFAQSVDDLPTIGSKGKDSMDKIIERRKEKEAEEAAAKAAAEAEKAAQEALKLTAAAREAAGPEQATLHTVKSGGSLTAISEEAYGRTRYWRILKLYNKVDPSKLQVGQEIKAPAIPWLLASSGLQERYPEAVANILAVKETLSEIQDKGSKPSDEDLAKIKEAASLIRKTEKLLLKETPSVTGRPSATVKQLQTVRSHLQHIANKTRKGRTDPNSLAHEHLSNSIVYGVLWAQGGFK